MKQIKRDLKDLKIYFENKEKFDKYYEMYKDADNSIQHKANAFGMCISCAPIHIQEIYLELYINHKTLFQLANEKYCSESYLEKRKSELFKYLYDHRSKLYP